MNYNTITELMVFERNEKLMDLINVKDIDTIIFETSRFVPYEKSFLEVVVKGPVSLLIQHKGNIMPAGRPAAYGGTSMTSSSHSFSGISSGSGSYHNLKLPSDVQVKIDPIFWVRKNGDMLSFLSRKQLIRIFPDKSVKIKRFIKQNRIKFYDRDHVARLINYINDLLI